MDITGGCSRSFTSGGRCRACSLCHPVDLQHAHRQHQRGQVHRCRKETRRKHGRQAQGGESSCSPDASERLQIRPDMLDEPRRNRMLSLKERLANKIGSRHASSSRAAMTDAQVSADRRSMARLDCRERAHLGVVKRKEEVEALTSLQGDGEVPAIQPAKRGDAVPPAAPQGLSRRDGEDILHAQGVREGGTGAARRREHGANSGVAPQVPQGQERRQPRALRALRDGRLRYGRQGDALRLSRLAAGSSSMLGRVAQWAKENLSAGLLQVYRHVGLTPDSLNG
eukprot:764735-Hanusia_phi.AAC.2